MSKTALSVLLFYAVAMLVGLVWAWIAMSGEGTMEMGVAGLLSALLFGWLWKIPPDSAPPSSR
jgi:uncharacterized transporter YbjL